MNFDEIVLKESPGLCRCCLSEGCYKDLATEYTWMSEAEVYADMLLECFDISISQLPDGPNGQNRLICEVCITRLRDACNFKKQVLDSEKKFIDMVARGEFKQYGGKVMVYHTQTKLEEVPEEEHQAEEVEVEYLDEEMEFEDDLPLRPPAKVTESEPKASVSDITVSALQVKGKRGRPKKSAVIKIEKEKPEEPKPKRPKQTTKEKIPLAIESVAKRRRTNLVTIFNNTTIIPFKCINKLVCFYCGKQETDYNIFVNHTMSHEPCNVKHKSLIMQKAELTYIKLDVSNITCRICKESKDAFEDIIRHLESHGIEYDHDVTMYISMYNLKDLKCVLCSEQFTKLRSLLVHVLERHVNKKLPCEKCGQNFDNSKEFLDHLPICRRLLAALGYSCNICNMSFKNSFMLSRHKADIHGMRRNTIKDKHAEKKSDSQGTKKISHKERIAKEFFEKIKSQADGRQINAKPKRYKDRRKAGLIRKNIACLLKFTSALPFKLAKDTFTCFYCSESFTSHELMRAHTIKDHEFEKEEANLTKIVRGPNVCVKFDISSLFCKICLQSFDGLDVIINHLIVAHKAGYDRSVVGFLEGYTVVYQEEAVKMTPNE